MGRRKFDCYMVSITMGQHPKFVGFTDGERCAHVFGVMALAAMSPVRGRLLVGCETASLPAQASHVALMARVHVRVAKSALEKLKAVGILEHDEEHKCLQIRHWDDYNPTPGAERTRRWRDAETSQTRHANRHATVTQTSPEVEVEVEVEAKASSEVVGLCELLAQRITSNDSRANPNPNSERWRRDMRLLLKDRNGDIAEIARVIDWCQQDSFWRANILSPAKLRKQFSQLLLKSKAGNVVPLSRSGGVDAETRAKNRELHEQKRQRDLARMRAIAEEEGVP